MKSRAPGPHVEAMDRHGLRVALLCYRGNPRCGGQGVYARHLSHALVAAGHSVTVFSGQPYPELDPGVEIEPIPSLDLYRDADPFRRPRLREIGSFADLAELVTMWSGGFGEPRAFSWRAADVLSSRRNDFDVIHDNHGLGTGILSLARAGWPVLASVHHPVTIDKALDLCHAENLRRRLVLRRWYGFSKMQSRVARRLCRLVTVSEVARADVISEMRVDPARVAVVPLGVRPSTWRPIDTIARVPGRIMTTTSADVPLKGLAYLIEALAKIRTERDDAHLVVVGALREGGAVDLAIEQFGLRGFVQFVGGESDDEVVRRYAEASVAVVPSLYEGFSLPAIEAMACGAPLVVTSAGALPEVVGRSGEAAIVVDPADAGALAHAITELLTDGDRAERLGAAGRIRARSCYSWERVAAATAEQYRLVMAERPC
ncbi:MAG: glycosyltransferase family 4 protein [Acidimicrobiales bacterium]